MSTAAAKLNLPTRSTAFLASSHNDSKTHLLLGASGSVATIKLPNILQALSAHPNLSIILILTSSATNFLAGQAAEQPHLSSLLEIPNVDGLLLDEDEWVHPWKRGSGVLHIELRRWAHMMAIVPLSANTLAKIVGGFADNLLTSVVRAWDTTGEIDGAGLSRLEESAGTGNGNGEESGKRKRILVAPAMNTAMWRHPVTKRQVRVLDEEWGVGEDGKGSGWFEVLLPMAKELACGDVGDGAMKDWKEIVELIEERLGIGR